MRKLFLSLAAAAVTMAAATLTPSNASAAVVAPSAMQPAIVDTTCRRQCPLVPGLPSSLALTATPTAAWCGVPGTTITIIITIIIITGTITGASAGITAV